MALYSALIPCVALVMLPVGTVMVVNGTATLADLVLVFCLMLSIGVPLLKALNFAGKFPQLNYKVDKIEKAMDNEPLKTNNAPFSGDSHDVSGNYKGRIYGAMVLSLLKGMLMKVPAVAVFLIVSAFIDGELTKTAGIYAAIALVGSVAVQAIFQNIAERLQSAAGYMIFADMRMKLGAHLRRLPMVFLPMAISGASVPCCQRIWCSSRKTA